MPSVLRNQATRITCLTTDTTETTLLFFFSSRRRHTSWPRDWSSDVCSSDLADQEWLARLRARHVWPSLWAAARVVDGMHEPAVLFRQTDDRSLKGLLADGYRWHLPLAALVRLVLALTPSHAHGLSTSQRHSRLCTKLSSIHVQ